MSQEYLYQDITGPNLDHPDSAIRLASVVHRFKVPKIIRKLYFTESFRTVGIGDNKTWKTMIQADDTRNRLLDSTTATKLSAERIISDSKKYLPYIHTILLSCKVQPEQARLDTRLLFEWKSGIETKPQSFVSEAMMYDLVMTIATTGLGYAVSAIENSVTGEFVAASRDYAAAAGIFHYLAEDQLPKWISKGSKVSDHELPSECHPPMALALSKLFMANGQQMAIATVLMKDGKPNYSLVAKLCYGVAEQLEDFISVVRKDCAVQKSRMDPDFYTAVALQINVQKSLSLYFQGRAAWDKDNHGIAIALLSEATVALKQRDISATASGAYGIPDISKIPALKPLETDLRDLRQHMSLLLRAWEKDNTAVYFCPVPQQVPATSKLQEGLQMKKMTEYTMEEVDPVLLVLPDDNTSKEKSSSSSSSSRPVVQRSDSDLARELQRQLNMER